MPAFPDAPNPLDAGRSRQLCERIERRGFSQKYQRTQRAAATKGMRVQRNMASAAFELNRNDVLYPALVMRLAAWAQPASIVEI
ncbi:hypothetical protein NP284_30580 [Rhodopseudomonas pseudopalustris]